MGVVLNRAAGVIRLGIDAAVELLWPTHCAVCSVYGYVLCPTCAANLPFLDQWRACPRCGAPYGLMQCCECNTVMLARLGRDDLPFAACASAVMFDRMSGRLIHAFKDLGEQRLARTMALLMCRAMPPSWSFDAITFIPASKASYAKRGFEHAGLIARELADMMGGNAVPFFRRPQTLDQRGLTRSARIENLKGRFSLAVDGLEGCDVLLVDDVYTTGATLCDATDALLEGGVASVKCLTFARV